MTEREAYRVLGIPPGVPKDQIKKRYRKLMLQLHPDALAASGEFDLSLAQKITLAYSVLKKSMEAENPDASRPDKSPAAKKSRPAWDAPLNPYAYREREILHYAEAFDGSVLGSFCVARGKYLWKTEEDFPLFLQSVYRCGKELLDEIDAALGRKKAPAIRQTLQAELTYLLAQQFIDGPALLEELAQKDPGAPEENPVYVLPAMLENAGYRIKPAAGERLLPSSLRKHRLYLKTQAGEEAGYLSFPDDRLYYVVIPLFEQRRVQVRVQADGPAVSRAGNPAGACQRLRLWMRFSPENRVRMPENLNLRIEALLKRYR
ncbi:MAG TPA: DnaJ domain-containing protein [Candidatus Limivivens intestinipullorum]|uniref:DnaJ domain-containing protein n=1 Tax=Candidatus Limivivens intestinipullorum TaxID=2840858 RepID=A0A9D1ES68_9FIRM|nr:DnaJ domain-containing protein [Candidatus Limivivens intestinipullorum]